MDYILQTTLDSWLKLALWLVVFFIGFGVLARFSPCNSGVRFSRREFATDMLYCFLMPVFNRFIKIGFISLGVFLFFSGEPDEKLHDYFEHGYGPVAQMPVWLQAAVIFLISDVVLYWTHRLFHGRALWRFHAIHHSSTHLDWMSTFRFHPINVWLTFTLLDAVMILAGFSPLAVGLLVSFNLMYSAMVHANLNWTFGPFKYIFASPVFHRWHHTAQQEGMDKNFAPTFPLLDIVFGTFYMPDNRLPDHYGVPGSDIPTNFTGQLLWPFKK